MEFGKEVTYWKIELSSIFFVVAENRVDDFLKVLLKVSNSRYLGAYLVAGVLKTPKPVDRVDTLATPTSMPDSVDCTTELMSTG